MSYHAVLKEARVRWRTMRRDAVEAEIRVFMADESLGAELIASGRVQDSDAVRRFFRTFHASSSESPAMWALFADPWHAIPVLARAGVMPALDLLRTYHCELEEACAGYAVHTEDDVPGDRECIAGWRVRIKAAAAAAAAALPVSHASEPRRDTTGDCD
jgi:hypothetical protein